MEENRQEVFRRETLDRISSPEQLTDYLRVANPGIWVVLAAVILMLAGFFIWASVGTLETTVPVAVVVEDHAAQVVSPGAEELRPGMPLRAAGQECLIASVYSDDFGRQTGTAEISLPDGSYEGTVVTEKVRPIDFLLTSR